MSVKGPAHLPRSPRRLHFPNDDHILRVWDTLNSVARRGKIRLRIIMQALISSYSRYERPWTLLSSPPFSASLAGEFVFWKHGEFQKSCPPLSQKLENLLHDVRSASRPIHWSTNLQIHVNIRHLPTRKVIVIPLWHHLRWRGLYAIAIGGLQGCLHLGHHLHLGHKLYMCWLHCTSCKFYFELAKKDCLSVSFTPAHAQWPLKWNMTD